MGVAITPQQSCVIGDKEASRKLFAVVYIHVLLQTSLNGKLLKKIME
jgi:hypothetical protein